MFFAGFKTRPVAAIASFLVVVYAIRAIKHRRSHRLPPGPRGLPLLGNVFQLSMTRAPWKQFELWKKQYGPAVYVNLAGQGLLILNTHEAAADLLDRRSHNYSNRPRWVMASEIFTGGLMLVFAQYGERWRRMRRAGHEAMKKSRMIEYHSIQMKEATILTHNILSSPSQWEGQLHRWAASTIVSILYGTPPLTSPHDPLVEKINEFTRALARLNIPGAFLVEFFPWMTIFTSSIAKWKRDTEKGFQMYSKMFEVLFRDVEVRINQGDERPSFVGTLIRERRLHNLSDSEIAWLAATMYTGAAESDAKVMHWFMLAMIAFPETQKRCQEELDAVVGRSRMPTFKDRDSLPYIGATVREIVRWRPVLPIGMPHVSKEDDWYRGFYIPKGTFCFPNVWSLNLDRDVYGEDSCDFNPGRFIDECGQLTDALKDTKDGHVTYGFGPRICLGRHMANDALFMAIASLLWAVNISPATDEKGRPVIPNTLDVADAELVIRPLPFECSITPRFPEAQTIVVQTNEML